MLDGAGRRGPTDAVRRWRAGAGASCGRSCRSWSARWSGRSGAHQRFLLAQQLAHIDFLDETIAQVSAEIAERLRPCRGSDGPAGRDPRRRPCRRPRSCWPRSAPTCAASRAPGTWPRGRGCARATTRARASGAAGKTRKGNSGCARPLIEAAQAAARTKDSYLAAQYRRLAARRGKKKAAVAVGHTILVIAYHLLQRRDDLPATRRHLLRRARPRARRAAARPWPGELGF